MNGWGSCDNVQETIESTVNDAIDWARLELSRTASRESNSECDDCGRDIPKGRQLAVPGVLYCIECQIGHDSQHKSYYNRRGSKDSQLR